jgi:hypothetical protein
MNLHDALISAGQRTGAILHAVVGPYQAVQ